MIQLTPICHPKVWGIENWIASTHPDGCQKDFLATVGDYPLLVKIIQADDRLSVQVHPDNQTAIALEGTGARGKTECWYVLDAAPDAAIIYGLKADCTQEELKIAIATNALESKLHIVNVKKGDFAFIPAGTVHAICSGVRLLEVQQNCNITYRLYDWGRGRELHIEKALKSVSHRELLSVAPMQDAFTCDYFSLKRLTVRGGHSFSGHNDNDTEKDWQLLFITSGNGKICAASADGTRTAFDFQKEHIFAVAPNENVAVTGNCEIIRIIPRRETLRL